MEKKNVDVVKSRWTRISRYAGAGPPALPARLLITILANALDEQIHFLSVVAFGQCNGRYTDFIKASRLSAGFALEMNVIVVVMAFRTVVAAKCIFRTSLVVQHFMQQSFIQKRPQRSIDRYPVMIGTETIFDIVMSQCVTGIQKQIKDFLPTIGVAKVEGFQGFSGQGHDLGM